MPDHHPRRGAVHALLLLIDDAIMLIFGREMLPIAVASPYLLKRHIDMRLKHAENI